MVKFNIHSKIWEGKRCQFGEVLEKCQNIDKIKGNLGQECVKGGLLSFQGKTGTVGPDFPGKMTISFSVLFFFSLFFEMSNNKAIS